MDIRSLNEEIKRTLLEDNEDLLERILNFIFNKNETITINSKDIPEFSSKKELSKWFQEIFNKAGRIDIKDTNITITLYANDANREAFKRRMGSLSNRAVCLAFVELLETSKYIESREHDERHRWDQQIYENELIIVSNNNKESYKVTIFVDIIKDYNQFRYAGHKTDKK